MLSYELGFREKEIDGQGMGCPCTAPQSPPFRGTLFSTLYGVAWGNSNLAFNKTSLYSDAWKVVYT